MLLDIAAGLAAALPASIAPPLRPLGLAYAAMDYLHRRGGQARRVARRQERFYERAWREAAGQLGATVKVLPGGILELSLEGARTRVHLNETAADDVVTLRLAGDKPAVHRILASAGIPVPEHAEFTIDRWRDAEAFLGRAGGPCVVKPARSGSAGRGVTTGVRDRRALLVAATRAAAFGSDLLIEREVEGDEVRLLFLDGRLVDAFVRRPPVVRGDGRATVRDLVGRENARRLADGAGGYAQTVLRIDPEMRSTLRRQGLSLRSVPAGGRAVVIKSVVSDNAATDNETVTGLSESIVAAARAAAEAVGVRLAGVDVVTRDRSRPLLETGGVVLEVNTTPGFYHHYHRADEPVAVAVPVLAALLGIVDREPQLRSAVG